jgi:hypothetical protein
LMIRMPSTSLYWIANSIALMTLLVLPALAVEHLQTDEGRGRKPGLTASSRCGGDQAGDVRAVAVIRRRRQVTPWVNQNADTTVIESVDSSMPGRSPPRRRLYQSACPAETLHLTGVAENLHDFGRGLTVRLLVLFWRDLLRSLPRWPSPPSWSGPC